MIVTTRISKQLQRAFFLYQMLTLDWIRDYFEMVAKCINFIVSKGNQNRIRTRSNYPTHGFIFVFVFR